MVKDKYSSDIELKVDELKEALDVSIEKEKDNVEQITLESIL